MGGRLVTTASSTKIMDYNEESGFIVRRVHHNEANDFKTTVRPECAQPVGELDEMSANDWSVAGALTRRVRRTVLFCELAREGTRPVGEEKENKSGSEKSSDDERGRKTEGLYGRKKGPKKNRSIQRRVNGIH